MLPDAVAMLGSIPGEFHLLVKPASGDPVDGVMFSPATEPAIDEFGQTVFAPATVFVAAPFACPRSTVYLSRDLGETWERRNVIGVQENATFLAISIGTEA